MNEYLLNPNVCPSSLGEDDTPITEGETAHKWDEGVCNECGTTHILSEIVQKPCPGCGGKLYFVAREDEDSETCLWCEDCTISIDSSGGYLT